MKTAPKVGVLSPADQNGDRIAKDTHRHRFIKLSASYHSKRWTLDPAGAMYGIHMDAMAAGNYGTSHVDTTGELPQVNQFGYHEQKLQRFAQIGGMIGLPYRVLFVAMRHLHVGIEEWASRSKLTLPRLLRLSDGEYKSQLMSLRSSVHTSLSDMTTKPEYQDAIQSALGG
jgi:hypothetical protein